MFCLLEAVGHEQRRKGEEMKGVKKVLGEAVDDDREALQELWVRDGLGNTAEKMRDWKKLRDVARSSSKRRTWSFSKEELPAIYEWFASRLFGGVHSNLPLEQFFSAFGQVCNANEGGELKEMKMLHKSTLRALQAER